MANQEIVLSLKTRFKVTDELLQERRQLHELVDLLWKCGHRTRSEVYAIIADTLGSKDVIHISDMDTSMMSRVATRFQQLLETDGITACSQCKYAGVRTNIGLIRCKLTGKPFCSTFNLEVPLSPCRKVET